MKMTILFGAALALALGAATAQAMPAPRLSIDAHVTENAVNQAIQPAGPKVPNQGGIIVAPPTRGSRDCYRTFSGNWHCW